MELFFKILFIYSRETYRERGRDIGRGRSREPNVGLNPGTPGSHPEPKAGTQPLSHSGVPSSAIDNAAVNAKLHVSLQICICITFG